MPLPVKPDKIVCFGKNYADHAKELGDAVPEKPVIFLKPASVVVQAKQGETLTVPYPTGTSQLHHECEIVVELGPVPPGPLSPDAAQKCIRRLTVGLDMTKRDLQAQLKKAGHPWTTAKVFSGSAIVGPWIEVDRFPQWASEKFSFSLNQQIRQSGHAGEMMFSVAECLSFAQEYFPLCEGDYVFTGTPAGVSAVLRKDRGELRWGTISYSVMWQ